MPLEVPEPLLRKLRARRAAQHAEREKKRNARGRLAREKESNFIERVGKMFGRMDAEGVAEEYVAAMGGWQDEVEAEHDAFLLDPGMGPMTYLTADGRILEDLRGWDGDDVREVEGNRVFIALVVGAKKTGIAELLDVLPAPPPGAATCSKCAGTRWSRPGPGFDHAFPCFECHALGWTVETTAS